MHHLPAARWPRPRLSRRQRVALESGACASSRSTLVRATLAARRHLARRLVRARVGLPVYNPRLVQNQNNAPDSSTALSERPVDAKAHSSAARDVVLLDLQAAEPMELFVMSREPEHAAKRVEEELEMPFGQPSALLRFRQDAPRVLAECFEEPVAPFAERGLGYDERLVDQASQQVENVVCGDSITAANLLSRVEGPRRREYGQSARAVHVRTTRAADSSNQPWLRASADARRRFSRRRSAAGIDPAACLRSALGTTRRRAPQPARSPGESRRDADTAERLRLHFAVSARTSARADRHAPERVASLRSRRERLSSGAAFGSGSDNDGTR